MSSAAPLSRTPSPDAVARNRRGRIIALPNRPRFRGVSHEVAFYSSLVVGPALVVVAPTASARVVTGIYAASLAALFGCSALLHRVDWSVSVHPWMRRLDHSMIFVFIAGTYTPVVALASLGRIGTPVLVAVWIGAAAGVLITLLWIGAPRWIAAGSYVAVGWIAVAAMPALWSSLGVPRFALLLAGGLIFTAGAVIYARKRPDPRPMVFGYHEVFHALVIVGVLCHVALVATLVRA